MSQQSVLGADWAEQMPELADLLPLCVERGASDVHLKVGSPPHLRIDGRLQPAPQAALLPADTERLAAQILGEARFEALDDRGEIDLALSIAGLGRFRVNVHRQRGSVGLVIRRVLPGAPSLADLGLPAVVTTLADEPEGLILVSSPSGSGKTTTLAAIVDRINSTRSCSIVTIEDPVEVLHADKKAIVSQREVGADTPDEVTALARMSRHDADVVVIGSLRNGEVVDIALDLAGTGHLVVASMTSTGASETLNRIVELVAHQREAAVRAGLARVLRGVVSQRLLDRQDQHGRVPAVEVLLHSSKVAARIAEGLSPGAVEDLIHDGDFQGMQTFDQSLEALVRSATVSMEAALAVSPSPSELRDTLEGPGYH